MNHFVVPPDASFENPPGGIRGHMEFNVLPDSNVWDIDLQVEECDAAIAIQSAHLA